MEITDNIVFFTELIAKDQDPQDNYKIKILQKLRGKLKEFKE